ncbi:cytochrome b561 and DOMON domain-containing protein At5g47530-like [Phragmites australis]|uniref:cytochrome b561 and DOMON domain-containing protein At5g47530-like n=1 Tax=Phragmites australis TaxID=29695 RepID=UPI002D797C58|nr:cytochrome b561 and DOMON domain-containing protein At5g47530-like [Phragmites australis]
MAGAAHHPSPNNMFISLLFLAAITCSSFSPSNAQSCASYTFSSNQLYASCASLPQLGATLHYNYTADTNTVAVAFRAPQSKAGWVAWGLNPNGTGMVGSQAVVAFQHSNGSLVAYPTLLDSYVPSMAPAAPKNLGLPVSDVAAEHVNGKEMVVYATVALPGKGSKFNHVWQQGTSVVNDVPAAHPTTGDNILSTGTIDFSD